MLDSVRYLLLQVRNAHDPMREAEVGCFARALRCPRANIAVLDLLRGCPRPADLVDYDIVLLGGSGDYSVVEGGPWLEAALDAMRELHDLSKPTFASCWGFQAMARAMGGAVVTDLDRAELGTHALHLTTEGERDPVFGPLGPTFLAQIGHQDIVDALPPDAIRLASTDLVDNQAYCFPGKPIYCTQFHPELDCAALMDRLRSYPSYVERIVGTSAGEFAQTLRETPACEAMLRRFVEHVVGQAAAGEHGDPYNRSRETAMKMWVGTSGYSYKEWKGHFYPEKMKAADMLAYYGEQLPAVEINNTFYRMPRTEVLESWASQVPEAFRFVIKASRRITHFKRLQDTSEEVEYLLLALEALDSRLGAILFQLPPNLKKDLPRFETFLESLPGGRRVAFEFRHHSWLDEEVYDCLRARDCPLCLADTDDDGGPPLVSTASWGYLRLRRANYDEPDLVAWAKLIRDQGWSDAFVFFKHEDEGAGPRMARAFLECCDKQA